MLSAYEKETVISYDDESEDARLYTCNKSMMGVCKKLVKKYPDKCSLKREDEVSMTFIIPKAFISISIPK